MPQNSASDESSATNWDDNCDGERFLILLYPHVNAAAGAPGALSEDRT
jgi:hypothetical protein